MIEFKKIGEKEWEKFPAPEAVKPPNRWEDVLAALEGGEIVEIPVTPDKLRGTRIGLGRSASTRGFKLEFRYDNGKLAVRRSATPLVPKEPKERKPRTKKTASSDGE